MIGEGECARGGEFLVELSKMLDVVGCVHRIEGECVWTIWER